MKKVYICGPITGYSNLNREAFDAAEKILLEKGFDPVNPHKICAHLDHKVNSHADYMRVCIAHLLN